MGRLIDTDDVYETIKMIKDPTVATDVLDHIIATTPTAYDVDKVISEIDRCSFDNTDWKYSANPKLASYYLSRTADVVDIVRRGGINGKY